MLKYLNFRPVQVIIMDKSKYRLMMSKLKEEFKSNPCPLCLLIKASVIAYDKVKNKIAKKEK